MSNPCPQYVPPTINEDSLARLADAIATGASLVKYSDKTVEYRSLNDMRKIYDWMFGLIFGCSRSSHVRVVGEYIPDGARPYGLENEEFRSNRCR